MLAEYTEDNVSLPLALGRLEAWLETMRGPRGYTGPVAHWWDSCLLYCGGALDWRYEGILCGYLNLFRSTQEPHWLEKAQRAGDDLVNGQLPDGHYWNSSFEHNPKPGGTPHEAAADIGLLELSLVLRERHDPRWRRYFETAERNLRRLIAILWNGCGFKDQPDNAVLVANKNATMLEAILLYQQLSAEDMMEYIHSARDIVLSSQVVSGWRAGATVHRGTFQRQISFGIYTARCIGAIARLMDYENTPACRDFLALAVHYLLRLIEAADGGVPLGHYGSGWGQKQMPARWISPNGDLLRALLQARRWVEVPPSALEKLQQLCIAAIPPSGGPATAANLGRLGQRARPDFRDLLPVVGWCDKLFRALTMFEMAPANVALEPVVLPCLWRGRRCLYREDNRTILLQEEASARPLYLWKKGRSYPEIVELWT